MYTFSKIATRNGPSANAEHHKSTEDIVIGHQCRSFIAENKDDLDLDQFYCNVKDFYIAASKYMTQKYPFDEELLVHAKVVDISSKSSVKFSSVEYFVKRFGFIPDEKLDELETEFVEYQADSSIVYDPHTRIDVQWSEIAQIEDVSRSRKKYSLLSSVMKMVMTIFHSNADCERIFSTVGKNKTKERTSMNTDTLNSLLAHKLAMQSKRATCYEMKYPQSLLKKAKQATYKALTANQQ